MEHGMDRGMSSKFHQTREDVGENTAWPMMGTSRNQHWRRQRSLEVATAAALELTGSGFPVEWRRTTDFMVDMETSVV